MLSCCTGERKEDAVAMIKQDSSNRDSVKIIISQEEIPERSKYTGTYNIVVTRFEDYSIDQRLELVQTGDSVKGVYKRAFFVEGNDPFASFVVNVAGSIRKNEKAESILFEAKIIRSEIDSVKLKQHPWAEKMAGEFTEGPTLYIRFSDFNNTIENNYAGGAWD